MSQRGYVNCLGCGRLFKENSEAEMDVLERHDCSWSDAKLDNEIGIAHRLRYGG